AAAAAAASLAVAIVLPAASTARPRPHDPALDVCPVTLAKSLRCQIKLNRHARRNAVLLVHGTGTNPQDTWGWSYVPALRSAGFRTCTVQLPDHALGDIQTASEYVVYAIRRIASLTGRKVDVIGRSQGT